MASGSKLKNAISWLGLVDDERFEESSDQQVEPVTAEASQSPAAVLVPEPDRKVASSGFGGDNSQTVLLTTGIVMKPTSYKEIQPIVDRYMTGLPTIVEMKVMSIPDAQRSLDFFSGVHYALHGSIRRLATGVFLLEPAGVTLDPSALDEALASLR